MLEVLKASAAVEAADSIGTNRENGKTAIVRLEAMDCVRGKNTANRARQRNGRNILKSCAIWLLIVETKARIEG
jgi:hypothetical protein